MNLDSEAAVREIMSSPVETVAPDETAATAAARMRDEDISALLVTTAPPSMVTTTDMLAVVANGESGHEVPVEAVMTEAVETVPPDLEVRRAAEMMTTYGITHLPVVDDDYLGVVSSTDITALQS
ncbi:MAG: CBS domain-containing protein [Natronomonas sp.]|jgi:CBS domain-containing protein